MRQRLFTAALVLCAVHAASVFATPQPFTPGDLAVYRVGDGTQTMSSTGNTVFIDEYTPTGSFVQSVSFNDNTANGNALITPGNATADGMMTRSANGVYLTAPGYNITRGSFATATSPRMVARVDANANIDLTTSLTNFNTGGQFRGVVTSDGDRYWMIDQNIGVWTTTRGSSSATTITSTTFTGRTINIYGDQLYATGSTQGVSAVGSGLPTTTGQTLTQLVGAVGAYNFFFADLSSAVAGLDTLYYMDDAALQVKKFSLVGSTWTAAGTVSVAGAAKGLTGKVNGTTVELFVVAGTSTSGTIGNGTLSTVTDASGYNVSMTGAQAVIAARTGASPGLGGKFQSVAFAPTAHASITTTAGPVSRGTAVKGIVSDLGGSSPVGFNNGQVSVQGNTDSTMTVALDIERGDAATSGATPSPAEIAALVSHLNDTANQTIGHYVATDLVANPDPGLPDSDFEVAITFSSIDTTKPQFMNFDLFRDTGLDVDRLFVVPEPAAMGTMLFGAVTLLSRRRKRVAA